MLKSAYEWSRIYFWSFLTLQCTFEFWFELLQFLFYFLKFALGVVCLHRHQQCFAFLRTTWWVFQFLIRNRCIQFQVSFIVCFWGRAFLQFAFSKNFWFQWAFERVGSKIDRFRVEFLVFTVIFLQLRHGTCFLPFKVHQNLFYRVLEVSFLKAQLLLQLTWRMILSFQFGF